MSVQIWSCCAFAAALIVAAFCQNSDGGNFQVTITIKKDLVNESENHWKLWCSTAYNTCQKAGRGLTTGHNARTDQQSDVPEDVMVAIETCYAFCMERYPPASPVQPSDTYPFGPADIVSYKCSEAFNASVCFSACLHHDHQSTLTTLGALLNKDFSRLGSCEQLCRQSRGVCARAFAPNTTEQNDECYQNCLSSTICEDMCHATSNLPSVTDGTGSRAPLNLLSRTHPRITRPLNNRTLWEDGVLEFTQGGIGARSVKIDQVYGLLWKLVNKDKTYFMAHHMSFFYLPDEVKYHRLPANFFSLPKDFECDRFEIVTAAVRAQSTSHFSEQDFVCAPGLSVPDPPSDVSVTLAFMNYTILDVLTFNLTRPSTEAVYCDYYLAKFIAGGQTNSTTMRIPTDRNFISLKGQDLLVGGKFILDSNVTLSLACVSNNITGLDELNWPTQTVFQTKVSLRALVYCGSHINEPTLVVNKASDPDTGFWSLNLTFRITAAQVSPQKFLYLGARGGQNIVYRVTNVLTNFTVPLKVGVFSYEQTLQSISPGEVTISGEVEESAQFKTELERISCSKCCLLAGTRDFKQKVSLKEIQPSPPMNVTLASQQLNTTARFLSITLRVLPPKHSAGRIACFRVKFGGPKVPNLFETTIAYNDSGIKNETILLSFQAPFEDVDNRWDFQVAAISNFGTQSEWFTFSMPAPYYIRPETEGTTMTGGSSLTHPPMPTSFPRDPPTHNAGSTDLGHSTGVTSAVFFVGLLAGVALAGPAGALSVACYHWKKKQAKTRGKNDTTSEYKEPACDCSLELEENPAYEAVHK